MHAYDELYEYKKSHHILVIRTTFVSTHIITVNAFDWLLCYGQMASMHVNIVKFVGYFIFLLLKRQVTN